MTIVNDVTTIQIPKKLKNELNSIKDYDRETYAEIIKKLLIRFREDEEAELELSNEVLKSIEKSREEVKKGHVYSTEQLRKELDL